MSEQKKERNRLKRLQKQKEHRRRMSVSPYQRFGKSGRTEECLINRDWRQAGIAAIQVLRSLPHGGLAMASFLVDVWCAGLKDAWGRLDISPEEFHAGVERAGANMDLVSVELDMAKRLVMGGIRLAAENGFRLPDRYSRWTAMLGEAGDWRAADISDFGIEGKYRWVGSLDELRRRLVGSTAEEFLAREDVDYIAEVSGEELGLAEDEPEVALEGMTAELQQRLTTAVAKWCASNGQAPHPRLKDAVEILMESMMQIPARDEGDDPELADIEELAAVGTENLEDMLSLESPKDAVEIDLAMAQLEQFVSQFKSPEDMFAAVGMGEDLGDDEEGDDDDDADDDEA